ncbi:InlB B-repeat-containing protein [Thioalkalivibrio thiocyanodenitrificans]|uniref:InlB B-repeat-containing protein n=1 Tax=Thioalkalivibrio thiocyanodenitrificans TaxID=243063 RepID=UPI000367A9E4|nr:InlB B-repeat-containing protein [Thioalkalivibrio thiocyanodenitrificans]
MKPLLYALLIGGLAVSPAASGAEYVLRISIQNASEEPSGAPEPDPESYVVSASAGDGGSVNPAMQEVLEGETANVGVSPDTGHSILSVSGCGGTLSGSTFVTAPVTAHCNVFAAFEANTYTLNLNAQGGSVTPSSQAVVYGEPTGTLPEPSRDGHNFLGWDWQPTGGSPWQASEPYLIAGDSAVYAQWDIESFMIVATAGAGGLISPASQLVEYGDTADFTVTPDTGYYIAAVTGCEGALAGSVYTTGVITGVCSVSASFDANTYMLSFDPQGGSVSPTSKAVVFDEAIGTLPTPTRDGHSFGEWNTQAGGDGVTWASATVYTQPSNATLYAQWDIEAYTVSASAGTGGSISPASQLVEYGDTADFTVSINAGYSLDAVTGCAGSLDGSTYTTGAISEDCSVSASFDANEYTLSFDAQGGTVQPSWKTVTFDSQVGTLPTPTRDGHSFAGWNTQAGGGGATWSDTTVYAVANDATLYAQWDIESYTVSTSPGEGGSISPTSRSVEYGDSTSFTITPDAGYVVVGATGCGGWLQNNTEYFTGAITEDCTVIASFEPDAANAWESFALDHGLTVPSNWESGINWTHVTLDCLPMGGASCGQYNKPYPTVTISSGGITVKFSSLSNVEGLSSVVSSGAIDLAGNSLPNVEGLRNLENVTGALLLQNNGLTTIDGLRKLAQVSGDLRLDSNSFTSLDGLSKLNYVGGDLDLSNNPNLVDLTGLETLSIMNGQIKIPLGIQNRSGFVAIPSSADACGFYGNSWDWPTGYAQQDDVCEESGGGGWF